MSAGSALQTAIYEKLTANAPLMGAVTGVFDEVPQDYGGFPYVTIGEDTLAEWDGDDWEGEECTVVIHSWSRYAGRKEVKIIQGYIQDALHRQTLSISGYNSVDCVREFSETLLDPDGHTRHGIQQFRVTITRN